MLQRLVLAKHFQMQTQKCPRHRKTQKHSACPHLIRDNTVKQVTSDTIYQLYVHVVDLLIPLQSSSTVYVFKKHAVQKYFYYVQ